MRHGSSGAFFHATSGVLLVAVLGMAAPAADDRPAAAWKAGVAAAKITPVEPLPMAGYAGRTEPAEGTEQQLFTKAIAIEDADGSGPAASDAAVR